MRITFAHRIISSFKEYRQKELNGVALMIMLYIPAALAGLALLWMTADLVAALRQKPIAGLPEESLDPLGLSLVYYYLTEPEKIPEGLTVDEEYISRALAPSLKYINRRYDCADFRLQLLFRLYKDCRDRLPQKVKEQIKSTFLNFKYWMDEPGADSLCFWSENHQLLFAVSEYLAGQEWPDQIFANSGMSGSEHMTKAIRRINYWMEQRFKYGFAEWFSNNYYAENLGAMANYIQYSRDRDSVERMKMILDLLWYDVATVSVNNTFVAASSRMYGDNKSGNLYGNRIRTAMETIWPKPGGCKLPPASPAIAQQIAAGTADLETMVKLVGVDAQMVQCFTAMYRAGCYLLPEVIYAIALDREPAVIKSSSGLNVNELVEEGLVGQADHQIMAQFGAEAFTNPEVIENTLRYLNRHKMLRNKFVNPFRLINIKLLRLLQVPRFISARFAPMTNGIALGRGNVYCYRNRYYALTTAVAHHVDSCGAQEHIWSANIAPDLAIYTTHPARDDCSHEKHEASPGYWVGNGRRPMSVQDRNINITIYRMPQKKRLLEFRTARITHAYMPREKFDQLELEGRYVFGRRDRVLVAMIANGELKYRPYDSHAASLLVQHDRQVARIDGLKLEQEFDLVREGGEYHIYITELSDTDTESYEQFKQRIRGNEMVVRGGSVRYVSSGKEYYVSYDRIFTINGAKQATEYQRYDSKYSVTARVPQTIVIKYRGKTLSLNYERIERKEILEP